MDIGDIFGRLKVLQFLPKSKVLVQCECGSTKEVHKGRLKGGNTNSCGCLQKELQSAKMKTHGMEGTPTYKSWNNMMMRCYNPNRINYPEYGGKGITVCEKWHTFQGFFEDMGVRPPGTSLNRKNGVKVYSKGGCEWASYSEQSFDQKKRSTNTSGRTGVSFQSKTGKWKAEIRKDGKTYFLGYFKVFGDAVLAREKGEILHFGRVLINGQEDFVRESQDREDQSLDSLDGREFPVY